MDRQNIASEIVGAVLVLRVRVQLAQQQVGGKNIIPHRCVNPLRIVGHGGRIGPLFMNPITQPSGVVSITPNSPASAFGTGIAAMVA